MHITLQSREPQLEPLREPAMRRIRQALRQLSWLAPGARVRLSEVQGSQDGIDKRCEVELSAEGAGSVFITSITRDWRSALQGALSRAVQALMRKLRPSRSTDAARRAIEHDVPQGKQAHKS